MTNIVRFPLCSQGTGTECCSLLQTSGCFSAYMGVFGTDRVGNHIKETLTAVGVEFSRCRTYEGENGYAVVDLIDGDRSFVSSNKGGVLREHPLRLTASRTCLILTVLKWSIPAITAILMTSFPC